MSATDGQETPPPWLDIVHEQVRSMRFGIVQIVIHEGQVVQIERTEKVRLLAKTTKAAQASASAFADG